MGFSKDSAFKQEEERLARWEEELTGKVLPTTTEAQPAERTSNLDPEGLYNLLDQALSALENGDVQGATTLVEGARNTVYSQLR